MPKRERNPFVKRGQVIEILIEDYAFGGKGIGRIRNEHGEFVVFMPNTLPGQLVRGQIKKTSKKYAEGKLFEVLKPSQDEVDMPYQDIPGAPYMSLPIKLQHQYKKESTLSLFKRIGKIENIEELCCVHRIKHHIISCEISSPCRCFSFSLSEFYLDDYF